MPLSNRAVGRTLPPVESRVKPFRAGGGATEPAYYRVYCGHAARCGGKLGDLSARQVRDPHRRRWECPVCGRRNDIPSEL